MPNGSQNLESVIGLAMEALAGRINTALPARVDSYDAPSQLATVTPMVKRPVPSSEGDASFSFEALPQIRDVRVIHPGGQDWALHIPLKPGDSVLLIVLQWDPSGWQQTGEVSAPADTRTHSIAHAIALPGYRRDGQRLAGVSSDYPTFRASGGFTVTLKPTGMEVGGASDAAALASKVNLLSQAFAAHKHAFIGAGTVDVVTPVFTHQDTASDKLKVGG